MAGHDGYTRYTIRIPTPLYERVKEAAGEASVNAVVARVLEEAFPPPEESVNFLALYELQNKLMKCETRSEAEQLVEEANRDLSAGGISFALEEQDGKFALLMAID